jgi:hypothetical protein
MRRDHSKVIWRTVVFAGAMLGAPACGGKDKGPQNPSNTATTTDPNATDPNATATTPDPANPCAANPCAGNPCNPCGDRPRGSDDEEGAMGRGFILS